MTDFSYSLVPMRYSFADGDAVWIDALQARTYSTPNYGDIVVTHEKLNDFVKNFKDNVRGIEIVTDYEHGKDTAKGSRASGTVVDMVVDGDKLKYQVAFTDQAKQEIKNGEWKYFSADWLDKYVHEDGSEYSNVILGGGLTNKPVAKGLSQLPVNFSELFDEKQQSEFSEEAEYQEMVEGAGFEFATLTSKQRSNLPKSKFLYVEPDGTPHLPVHDMNHVRAAISRLSQSGTGTVGGKSWLSPALRSRLLAKARAMLSRKQGGEMDELKKLCELLGIQFSETFSEDGEEAEQKLFTEILAKVTELNTELEPVRQLKEEVKGNTAFSEQFPDEYAELQELKQHSRNRDSKEFSEKIGSMRFKDSVTQKVGDQEETVTISTSKGLSAKCLDEVQETHRKLSEGKANATDFEKVMTAIFDNGIVDYGEVGTTKAAETKDAGVIATDIKGARQQFAEKVAEIQKANAEIGMSFREAMTVAAKDNPQLFEAYMEVK
jgi:Mu-like prophage I protein